MSGLIGWRRLLVPAVLLFVIALVARLPAAVALGWLLPDAVETRGIDGTLWRGSIEAVAVNGVTIGPVDWRWRPAALLRAHVGATVEAGLPGGFFDGRVSAGFGGVIELVDARAAAALGPLTRRSSVGAAQGTVRASIDRLRLDDLWPERVEGTIQLADLRYAGTGDVALGSYRLVFDGARSDDAAFPVAGRVESVPDGPFDVDGVLRLGPERAYAVQAAVSTGPAAPPEVARALMLLPASPDGGRTLRFEGRL